MSSVFLNSVYGRKTVFKEFCLLGYNAMPSVGSQRTTRRYIREDRTLHNHPCENLKSYKTVFVSVRVEGFFFFYKRELVSLTVSLWRLYLCTVGAYRFVNCISSVCALCVPSRASVKASFLSGLLLAHYSRVIGTLRKLLLHENCNSHYL
jgi:hypothetical protein